MVENPGFVVGISMLSVMASETKVLPVSAAIFDRWSLLELPRDTLFELAVVENLCFAVGIFIGVGTDRKVGRLRNSSLNPPPLLSFPPLPLHLPLSSLLSSLLFPLFPFPFRGERCKLPQLRFSLLGGIKIR